MSQDLSWIERVTAAGGWEAQLTALLDTDMFLIRPFSYSKIRDHPFVISFLELLRKDESAVSILIGYLENYDVLGQWSLILLPGLTGENPVPEDLRDKDELQLELTYWTEWAERKGIEPIL